MIKRMAGRPILFPWMILSIGATVVLAVLLALSIFHSPPKASTAASSTQAPVVQRQPTETPAPTLTQNPTLPPGTIPAQANPSPPPPTPPAQRPAGHIVFTCTRGGFNQICRMAADGSQQTRLTYTPDANDYYPSISPDGQSIVFASNRTGQFEVFRMNLDGSEQQQLTSMLGSISAPAVSHDGTRIVFAVQNGQEKTIWIMNQDGSDPHSITDNQWVKIDPDWAPDDSLISFAGENGGFVELWTMKPDGSDIRQVPHSVAGIGGRNSWLNDGKTLAFYAGPQGDRDVYRSDIDGQNVLRLTSGGNNTGPCFSPDGEWIAFASSRTGAHAIFTMRSDGSQVTQLTFNAGVDDWQPRWGP